jgi:hypothetical protein
MTLIPEGFKVKLARDYTRYHRGLRSGLHGIVEHVPVGRAALSKNQFLSVKFIIEKTTDRATIEKGKKIATTYEENITIDVLRSDLEVVDKRWTEWQEREVKEREDALKNHVLRATLYTTKRGGFLELLVEYDHGRPNDRWKRRSECKLFLADLEARGILEELVKQKEG